jgi:hypothetical protein
MITDRNGEPPWARFPGPRRAVLRVAEKLAEAA